MGTIGGNLAHGDAANDQPAVMMVLEATIQVTGSKGTRNIPIDEFFFGFYETALEADDILTEIHIPTPTSNTASAYHKLERKVGDYATVGIAVQLTMQGGTCTGIRIGLTNVNSVPMRAKRSEQVITGNALTDEVLNTAAQYASEDCNPSSDLRGSEEYKRAMVGVLLKRMVKKAADRIA